MIYDTELFLCVREAVYLRSKTTEIANINTIFLYSKKVS